jgi:elongation factor Ts
MEIKADQVKELRERSGVGMMDAKKALVGAGGDMDKAIASLKEKSIKVAAKKSDRSASEGMVETYTHGGRIGVTVEVNCETDFVARNPEFKEFAHDIAMQIASMAPANVDELYEGPFIKDSSLTIRDLRNNLVQKMGENIQIKRFIRFELGGEE